MLTKDNTYRVAKLFFDSPERLFHIREMARLTGLSAPGVVKIVSRLKKRGLLTSEKSRTVEIVKASKTDVFLQLKRCHNLLGLYESGLVAKLREAYEEPEAIVLFGSFAKGEDISKSDIDIAIITKKQLGLRLSDFEKMLDRSIKLYEIQLAKAEKEFLNTLANGIVLYGYLKVV